MNIFHINNKKVMPINHEVKKLISELKFKRETTQAKIATELGIQNTYLSDVINGRVPFSKQLEAKIRALLKQTTDKHTIGKLETGQLVTEGTPIYGIEVCGAEGKDFTKEAVIGHVRLPEINPASIIVTASGDHMKPLINHLDKIMIREIHNKEILVYGHIYLIVTTEYKLIRYIRKHPTNPDMLLLISENKKIDPFELHRDKICRLFLVENVLIIKNLV